LAQAKLSPVRSASRSNADEAATQLAHLRADLAAKSAIYSDRNYQVQALKRQIEALQKIAPQHSATATSDAIVTTAAAQNPDVDALETQQKSVQVNLEAATQKFAAARLGEKLEQDQQSEKLEVIDQPTQPQEPIRPNRPKIVGVAAVLALMAATGITLLSELLDKAVRRSSDLYSVISSELVVSIPYIFTESELRYRKKRFRYVLVTLLVLLVAGAGGAYWFLPPLDLLIAKARVGVFR
jgi:type II secretory pathway component PulM